MVVSVFFDVDAFTPYLAGAGPGIGSTALRSPCLSMLSASTTTICRADQCTASATAGPVLVEQPLKHPDDDVEFLRGRTFGSFDAFHSS
ncbi:hypothetical protein ASF44_30630 [Pseudorhodoferax sp. Leaf274]|nr:hypothetical protein ASF44_30630 [Pseudorhodoferax sp. Leaf274]